VRSRQVSGFTALSEQIHAAGLMRRRYGYYWTKMLGLLAAFIAVLVAFVWIGDSWWQLITAAVLALVMTQMAFLGHDAGHRQIFVSGKWNDWVSLIIANLLVGISHGWWQSKHSRHHGNPNKVGADPDIELKAVAFTDEAVRGRRTALTRWLATRQGWLFFPMLLGEGLSLHLSGFRRAFGPGRVKRRWAEISFLIFRIGGFVALTYWVLGPGKAPVFIAVELAAFGLYLGATFAPNHVGMPIVPRDAKLDFLQRQVMMSRNVSGGRAIDIAMGGLNHQIEHHLFPSMPRPSLRRAQPIVAAYCREHQVTYTRVSLWSSFGTIVRHLNRLGLGARDPFVCPLVASTRL
jgi:fatty acid desaturase